MTVEIAAAAPRFAVGRVIALAFSMLLRHPLLYAGLAIVIAIPGTAFSFWYDQWYAASLRDPLAIFGSKWKFTAIFAGVTGIDTAISVATFAVMQAVCTIGLLEALRGREVTLSHCLRQCLRALPRLLALSLILAGATALAAAPLMLIGLNGQVYGIYLLAAAVIVGVIYLLVVFWVAVPAIAIEGQRPLWGLQRSLDLTRGHRWRILALVLLPSVITIPCVLLLRLLVDETGTVFAVADFFINVVYMLAHAMPLAVGYYHLRAEKEGFSVTDTAAVFD